MARIILLLTGLAMAALTGCTVQHFEHDTAETLEWLRFKHGTRMHTATRWQLPRHTRIEVVETGPAADPSWLAAAQAGVDRVFPAPPAPRTEPLELLVSWPAADGGKPRGPRVSLWEVVDMDQFLPDFQQPMLLQVALRRPQDGALLEAGQLEVSPRWFASQGVAPELVQDAFTSFAARLRPTF